MKRLTVALLATLVLTGCTTSGTTETSDDTQKSDKGKVSSKKAPKKDKPGIGDPVRDGKFQFTVTKVRTEPSVGTGILREEAQGVYVLVNVKVKNIGDEAQMLDNNAQKLFDTKGREFSTDTKAQISMDSKAFLEEINPGNSIKGVPVFDVPKKAKPKTLELHDSMFSGGVKVSLK